MLVTILAFVFIPISLASSIFGMNVQEINKSGHSVWAFVICAIAMLVASGLVALTWRALKNLDLLVSAKDESSSWNDLPLRTKFAILHQDLKRKGVDNKMTRWETFEFWAGLRRLEKLDQAGV